MTATDKPLLSPSSSSLSFSSSFATSFSSPFSSSPHSSPRRGSFFRSLLVCGCAWSARPRLKRLLTLALVLVALTCLIITWDISWSPHPLLGSHRQASSSSAATGASKNGLQFQEHRPLEEMSHKQMRRAFYDEFEEVARQPGAGSLYGGTVVNIVPGDIKQSNASGQLAEWNAGAGASGNKPFKFNPYPKYNSASWKRARHAEYVACKGHNGELVDDVSVFVGQPAGFPAPSYGSYEVFGIDPNLSFERDTLLGQFALSQKQRNNTDWGALQQDCLQRNQARFDLVGPPRGSIWNASYADTEEDLGDVEANTQQWLLNRKQRRDGVNSTTRTMHSKGRLGARDTEHEEIEVRTTATEARTAILLRSYTGKRYTEDDKLQIRALVSELSLRSGGEFQVFLLVQVKHKGVHLTDSDTYNRYLDEVVPREFRGMTLLWNDELVKGMYPRLSKSRENTVHNAQYLSVQHFMQEFREFDYVWNWEMDTRIIGHAYDVLTKLGSFAEKQPRRGLWERNERFYIPGFHGDYDTDFRKSVEAGAGNDTVWYPPSLPFIRPIGPSPPVSSPEQDDYAWGVGEGADLITLSPMFDPVDSGWILTDRIWAYNDATHPTKSLPRRASLVTQCRLSRRLIDAMHIENLRGNHVYSEMTPGTVALLHGLKAVFTPIPIFMDRPLAPERIAYWYNSGPRGGSSCGYTSPMSWGQEGRFKGTTWYFRADPPQRLYNNWMGYEDNGRGGVDWEMANGRPCLPALLMHPIKDVVPTKPGYSSDSKLPYG